MTFTLRKYKAPDFEQAILMYAPDVVLQAAPRDGVAPDGYHATSIYPEYYRVCGKWLLAQDSRMDCVAVYHDGRMDAVEFRNLRREIWLPSAERRTVRKEFWFGRMALLTRESQEMSLRFGREEAGKHLSPEIMMICTNFCAMKNTMEISFG